jgi:hypothetical protein
MTPLRAKRLPCCRYTGGERLPFAMPQRIAAPLYVAQHDVQTRSAPNATLCRVTPLSRYFDAHKRNDRKTACRAPREECRRKMARSAAARGVPQRQRVRRGAYAMPPPITPPLPPCSMPRRR